MSTRIAQLYVELSARTTKLEAGLKSSQGQLTKFKGGLNDAVRGLTGFDAATLGTAAIVGGLAAGLKFAVGQALEAETAMALTEAAIKATGGAAGLTAEEVANMASRLSMLTGIADDVIQSGQNMLLTFKEIKGDTFERATVAMNDMAVAMNSGSLEGLNLKDTAVQLGKALNDPVLGLTALARVGVQFTTDQKDAIKAMVEMNDVAGAQAIILAELESEFGGAAEAAGNAAAGSFAKLKNAVSELAEELGKKLIPPLVDAAEAATLLIQWNEKLDAAYAEQNDRLFETAASYEDYIDGMLSAAVISGKLSQQQADLIKQQKTSGLAWGEQARAAEAWADSVGIADRAVFDYRNELTEAEMIQLRFGTALTTSKDIAKDAAGGFAEAGKGLDGMAEAGKTAGDHLSTVALVTADAAKQTDAYRTAAETAAAAQAAAQASLDARVTGYYNLAAALKDATALELAQTQLNALDELFERGVLSQDEYKAATEGLGLAFGIFTPQSLALAAATDELVKLYAAGRISADDLTTATGNLATAAADGKVDLEELGISVKDKVTPEFSHARDQAELFEGVLNRLDGRTVTNTVHTNFTNSGIAPGEALSDPGTGAYSNFAHGGEMTVPPGYPNDSYLVGLTSGEHISVETADGNGGGAGTYTFNIYPAAGTNGAQLAQQLRRAIQSGAGLTGN